MSGFGERIIRAAKLDWRLYEEVEADRGATGQAFAVIIFSNVAAGIGSIAQAGISGVVVGTVTALAGWYIWAFLTYVIGTRLLPQPQTSATLGQLLRTIGFSASPGLIRIFGFIPGLGPLLFLVAALWMLAAMIIGVRQALDYTSTLRAVGVCLVGWLVQLLLLVALFSLAGPRPS